MFGSRRHRASNPPGSSATVDPNASSAAAAAFMSAQQPHRSLSLSSAAAAAALRARPQTPTNVAEVQTKRMLRRSPSLSSTSSGHPRERNRPTLQRRASSGSMTERTFRSPSPHGSERGRAQQQNTPPVPAIPLGHRKTKTADAADLAGVGMQQFRTASQKMDAGLPSWYTKPTGDTSNVRTSDAPMDSKARIRASMMSLPERPESRSSINFSYPGRLRAQSPPVSPSSSSVSPRATASPQTASRTMEGSPTRARYRTHMVYDPNSRRMVPKLELIEVAYHTRETAEKQPRRKKKEAEGLQRSGSHLSKGTVARPKGTVMERENTDYGTKEEPEKLVAEIHPPRVDTQVSENQRATQADVSPFPREDQQEQAHQLLAHELVWKNEHEPSSSSHQAPQITSPQPRRSPARKPSVVEEESDEEEEVEPAFHPSQEMMDTLDDAVPLKQAPQEEDSRLHIEGEQSSPGRSVDVASSDQPIPSHGSPEPKSDASLKPLSTAAGSKPIAELSRRSESLGRSASNSPARTARFATAPSEQLGVKHEPPPRSASPMKSALKQSSPSPRDESPSGNVDDTSKARMPSPEDASLSRRKSARVSFDDRNTMVVGEATPVAEPESPVQPSPQQQVKRPWYSSIGRSKRNQVALEEDEIMKPRPALPSFGSIREKKVKEPEERPLVRPHEPARTSPPPAPSKARSPSPPKVEETRKVDTPALGQSSDHAIGSILAQDQLSRNEANISRFREPLPPVVTSVEGSGYASDSSTSSEEPESAVIESDMEGIQSTQTTQPETTDNSQNGSTILEEKTPAATEKPEYPPKEFEAPAHKIPSITVIQPTPLATDEPEKSKPVEAKSYFGMPGGFPEEGNDRNGHTEPKTAAKTTSDTVAAVPSTIFEPEAEALPSQAKSLPQTTLTTTPKSPTISDESDEESNGSIYSDAYEDLSEMEGDGFQSLNAVVESPVTKIKPKQGPELPVDTAPKTEMKHLSTKVPAPSQLPALAIPEPPRGPEDWEQAKIFWRSLTAEKRRELEQEAMEDAGVEGDREDVGSPVRRSSTRRKTSEQKLRAVTDKDTQIQAPAAPKFHPVNPERVYQIKPGTRADFTSPAASTGRMRTSMRGEQPGKQAKAKAAKNTPGQVHMRRSMRTMRPVTAVDSGSQQRVTSQPERPAEPSRLQVAKTNGKPNGRAASIDAAALAQNISGQIKPGLQRRDSDASDSSFKRSRAGPPAAGFSFRSTMRQASAPQPPADRATRGSGRFSIRSLSPVGSPFRRASASTASGPPVSMMSRRTLRSGSESSHEGKPSSIASITFPTFRRSGKAAGKGKQTTRSSRLDESSDEDRPGTSGFRSRFEDSSDEEEAPQSAPAVRPATNGRLGAVKEPVGRRESESSSDLPDSDDEKSPSRMQPAPALRPAFNQQRTSSGIGSQTLKRSGSGRGSFSMPTTTTMPNKGRRSSFMDGILRRNKRADQAGKIQRSDVVESAARRDTKLERGPSELKEMRSPSGSIRLQKRPPGMVRDDSWPLPLDKVKEEERPGTADGRLSRNGEDVPDRPPSHTIRRSASLGSPREEMEDDDLTFTGMDTVPKKKKKFGALRRMFKLDG